MPKVEYRSNAKPSVYAPPPLLEEKKREENDDEIDTHSQGII